MTLNISRALSLIFNISFELPGLSNIPHADPNKYSQRPPTLTVSTRWAPRQGCPGLDKLVFV